MFRNFLGNNFFFGQIPRWLQKVISWGPVLGRGQIPGPVKNGKTRFPGARGPEIEKNSYHAIRDGCLHLFYVLRFDRPDPQGREIAKYRFFRPLWPRASLGTSGHSGPKMEKYNFMELGALLGEISVRPKSFSLNVRNFFTVHILADRTHG